MSIIWKPKLLVNCLASVNMIHIKYRQYTQLSYVNIIYIWIEGRQKANYI